MFGRTETQRFDRHRYDRIFLGASYGAMVVVPLANASIEAPALVLETVDTSVSDLLLRPLDVGWHSARADVTAGFQLYADGTSTFPVPSVKLR